MIKPKDININLITLIHQIEDEQVTKVNLFFDINSYNILMLLIKLSIIQRKTKQPYQFLKI